MLAQLTASEVKVHSPEELRVLFGRSHYRLGLLHMLEATNTPGLSPVRQQSLMEEAYRALLLEQQQQQQAELTRTQTTNSSQQQQSFLPLPPPVLEMCMSTSMVFQAPPLPASLQSNITYFKLFGRVAAGSNVKVRLTDRLLQGLGIEVSSSEKFVYMCWFQSVWSATHI